MKETINNSKKIIIIAIIIILFLLIGTAFAYLTTTLSGEKEYLIRVESLNLTLNEGNKLTLERVIPLEDEEGMKLDGFTFSLTNNGNKEADYYIYLDDLDIGSEENRIEDYSLRYSLTRNDEVFMTRNLSTMGSNPNRRVDFGTISPDETINYTLRIWIDYEATSEEASGKTFKGKLRVVSTQPVGEKVADVLLADSSNNINTTDKEQTFITGENPNNYIWYSGKLWRAVSIDPSDNSVKLVTQWNISSVRYNSSDSPLYEGSYIEEWLNDTSVDGFLGNLRDYERFIKLDSKWNATMMSDTSKPPSTTIVEDAVGLLNVYEHRMSYSGTDYANGYLNNGLRWWLITPYDDVYVRYCHEVGSISNHGYSAISGVRPSINLNSDVKIVSGSGTENDPYRLLGDNDEVSGTLLSTRFSGEYIRFGTGENNLYRIVSHEIRGLTKITSVEPLKENETFKTIAFGDNINYSSDSTIGSFLNNDYLNVSNGYLTTDNLNMISDNTTWYLGAIGANMNYKFAKYSDISNNIITTNVTTSKVGLLRFGELMEGQFERYMVKGENTSTGLTTSYWILTPYDTTQINYVIYQGDATFDELNSIYGIKPALNLKSNVIIIGGVGTKENPFQLAI